MNDNDNKGHTGIAFKLGEIFQLKIRINGRKVKEVTLRPGEAKLIVNKGLRSTSYLFIRVAKDGKIYYAMISGSGKLLCEGTI